MQSPVANSNVSHPGLCFQSRWTKRLCRHFGPHTHPCPPGGPWRGAMSFLTVCGALVPTHRQTDLRSLSSCSEGRRTSYLTQLEGRTRVRLKSSAWCRPRAARVGCIPNTPQSYHRARHNCDTLHLRSSRRICSAPARTSRTPREGTRSKRFAPKHVACAAAGEVIRRFQIPSDATRWARGYVT